jgi:hypothetical protein
MKTIVWQLFMLLMVMSTLGVAEAKAQVQVQLKISTPFVAGNATFPSHGQLEFAFGTAIS